MSNFFQNLKFKSRRTSKFKSMKDPVNFHRSPGTSSSETKGNEEERKVRCKICGWVCDRERDSMAPGDSYAGLGIDQGVQIEAGTSIGDRVVPASGAVASSVDQYYDRTMVGGCPSCGSYLYDPNIPVTKFPNAF